MCGRGPLLSRRRVRAARCLPGGGQASGASDLTCWPWSSCSRRGVHPRMWNTGGVRCEARPDRPVRGVAPACRAARGREARPQRRLAGRVAAEGRGGHPIKLVGRLFFSLGSPTARAAAPRVAQASRPL